MLRIRDDNSYAFKERYLVALSQIPGGAKIGITKILSVFIVAKANRMLHIFCKRVSFHWPVQETQGGMS